MRPCALFISSSPVRRLPVLIALFVFFSNNCGIHRISASDWQQLTAHVPYSGGFVSESLCGLSEFLTRPSSANKSRYDKRAHFAPTYKHPAYARRVRPGTSMCAVSLLFISSSPSCLDHSFCLLLVKIRNSSNFSVRLAATNDMVFIASDGLENECVCGLSDFRFSNATESCHSYCLVFETFRKKCRT